jgi:dihydrodipicolinate synthase/N-acetylneuraminate lyase
MKKKLFGVYVPLITPLSADGEQINESELRACAVFCLKSRSWTSFGRNNG